MSGSGSRERATGESGGGSRFEAAFVHAPIGMAVVSADGRFLQVNDALSRLLGSEEKDLVGVRMLELTHPDDLVPGREHWRELQKRQSEMGRIEQRMTRRDGTTVWVAATSTFLRDAAGSPLYAVVQIEDIDSRRQAEEATRLSRQRYSDLFERSNDIVFATDLDGVIVSINPAAERITGYAREQIVGRSFVDFVAVTDVARARRMLDRLLAGSDETTELEIATNRGSPVYIEASSRLVREDGRAIAIEGIARETTERHALQEELARQAFHDSLTGLPNRALFVDRLTQALARAERPGTTLAVMLLNIDDFKQLNGRLGRDGADELLQAIAPRLQQKLRGSDTVARLGSDEFGFIIEDIHSAQQVVPVAERILTVARDSQPRSETLTATLGITLAEPGVTAEAILARADYALHRGKTQNRGSFQFFEHSFDGRASGEASDDPRRNEVHLSHLE